MHLTNDATSIVTNNKVKQITAKHKSLLFSYHNEMAMQYASPGSVEV